MVKVATSRSNKTHSGEHVPRRGAVFPFFKENDVFTDTELAQIKETFEAIPNWATVSWCPEGERMLFTITPTIDITFDGRTEISARDVEELRQEIEMVYENFDVDLEVSRWIGEDGHGRNGAPYHIRDILKEMEQMEQMYEIIYIQMLKQ